MPGSSDGTRIGIVVTSRKNALERASGCGSAHRRGRRRWRSSSTVLMTRHQHRIPDRARPAPVSRNRRRNCPARVLTRGPQRDAPESVGIEFVPFRAAMRVREPTSISCIAGRAADAVFDRAAETEVREEAGRRQPAVRAGRRVVRRDRAGLGVQRGGRRRRAEIRAGLVADLEFERRRGRSCRSIPISTASRRAARRAQTSR